MQPHARAPGGVILVNPASPLLLGSTSAQGQHCLDPQMLLQRDIAVLAGGQPLADDPQSGAGCLLGLQGCPGESAMPIGAVTLARRRTRALGAIVHAASQGVGERQGSPVVRAVAARFLSDYASERRGLEPLGTPHI